MHHFSLVRLSFHHFSTVQSSPKSAPSLPITSRWVKTWRKSGAPSACTSSKKNQQAASSFVKGVDWGLHAAIRLHGYQVIDIYEVCMYIYNIHIYNIYIHMWSYYIRFVSRNSCPSEKKNVALRRPPSSLWSRVLLPPWQAAGKHLAFLPRRRRRSGAQNDRHTMASWMV